MNRIERGFTLIAAMLCVASSHADEYSGSKQAGSAARYTFSWPLDANAVAPRGGTTKGPPVTLDREPSKQWNELRARIENNPPRITTWINGVKIMEWQEKEVRHPAKGGIALQVHGGGDHTKEFVRYRNIQVKRLDP